MGVMLSRLKKSILIFFSLAIILLLLPGLLGVWVQRHQVRLFRALDRTPGVTVKVLSYHRGWFQSHSLLLVKINAKQFHTSVLPGFPWRDNVTFQVKETIQHGPLVFIKVHGRRHPSIALALYDGVSLSASVPLHCGLLYRVRGVTSHFSLSSLSINQMIWKNVQGEISVAFGSGVLHGVINIGHLAQLPSKLAINQSWSIDHLRVRFDLLGIHWLSGGSNIIQVGRLQWQDEFGRLQRLSGILIDVIQSKFDGKSNFDSVIHVNSYHVGKRSIGPYHLMVSVNDLNVKYFRRFLLQMSRALDWKIFYQQQFNMNYSDLARLLSSGARISVKSFSVNTLYGPLLFRGSWQFMPVKQATWLEILNQAKLFVYAAVPRGWLLEQVRQFYIDHVIKRRLSFLIEKSMDHLLHEDPKVLAQHHIDHWQKAGYLSHYGDQWISTFRFQGGQVSINKQKKISIKNLGL